MESSDRKKIARPYMCAVIAAGCAALALAAYNLPTNRLGVGFYALALLTVCLGSRISVQIPRVKGEVTITDTFVFLTLLLFGGECAALLGAVEAFCSSIRFTKKRITWAFNAATSALAYSCTAWTLRLLFGGMPELVRGSYSLKLLFAVGAMALVQYVGNSALVVTGVALKAGEPIWKTWKENFLYAALAFFASASAAAIIAKIDNVMGAYALILASPILAIIHFTYRMYLKSVKAGAAQAQQAQAHVCELSQHIAEQERVSRQLTESEAQFRNAFDHAAIGMALISPEGSWLQINESLYAILGYAPDEIIGANFSACTHEEDLEAARSHRRKLLRGESPTSHFEMRFVHKSGAVIWAHVSLSLVRGVAGAPLHFIAQIQDTTERKRALEQLESAAFHDALTNLPNRVLFVQHIQLAISEFERQTERLFAVFFIDLDRFKNINDSLGHKAGDELLTAVARRLESCLRSCDLAARFGGDEFAILLKNVTDVNDVLRVAERVEQEISKPINALGHEVFTTASIGIALSATGYHAPEDVLRDADTAMYRAKEHGKARYEIFDTAMRERAMTLLQIENDLRKAVERGEFFVVYQPIVNLNDGELAGFEALLRWKHPERGIISPADFIPVAEETGLIRQIGRWVLQEACMQLKVWQRQYQQARNLTMSVNLSGRQFAQIDLVEQIRLTLEETGIEPGSLRLEITESVIMENAEDASRMLKQLKALGVQLSIDDFGTGYSSLSYLHKFPVNILKVDRSFVMLMERGDANCKIVETIIALAHNLKMRVVAEGVEQDFQARRLRQLNCEYAQGYFFSKPVVRDEAERMVKGLTGWHLDEDLSEGFDSSVSLALLDEPLVM